MFSNLIRIMLLTMPLIFERSNLLRISLSFILSLMMVALNISILFILSHAVEMLTNNSTFSIRELTLTPLEMVGVFGFVWTITRLLPPVRKLIVNPVASSVTHKMAHRCVEHLMSLSQRYHVTTPLGVISEIINKCLSGTTDITFQLLTSVIPTIIEVVSAIVLLSLIYGPHAWIGGLILAGTLAGYTIYNMATASRIAKAQTNVLQEKIQVSIRLMSMLQNYETIHLFSSLRHELAKTRDAFNASNIATTQAANTPDKVVLGQALLLGLSISGLYMYIGYNVLNRKFSASDFAIASYYLLQLSSTLMNFGEAINKIQVAAMDLKHVADFFDTKSEVVDRFPNRKLQVNHANAEVEFDNVNFNYDAGNPILQGVSFKVPAGKRTGIIGISGAGKSTIVKLLFRLYDVTGGCIRVNGQDIRDVSIPSLRSAISVVPQQPVLFNDSLLYNIWYGAISSKGEKINKEDVAEAVSNAHLNDYVTSLPEGLNTVVGERGLKISGGQLQRVAIARAYIKNPLIYIFDEATSALDSVAEREVQSRLDAVSSGITTLVITHKLYTLRNADNVIILSDGKVVEQGTPQELLEKKGIFADLWSQQVSNVLNTDELKENPKVTQRLDMEPVEDSSKKGLFPTRKNEIEEKRSISPSRSRSSLFALRSGSESKDDTAVPLLGLVDNAEEGVSTEADTVAGRRQKEKERDSYFNAV